MRLKTDENKETTTATEHTENKQSTNQNAFDDTGMNLDDNTYYQRDTGNNGVIHKVDLPNWTFILFVVIGIIVIFVQINTIRNMVLAERLKKSGQSTDAEITDVDRHYRRRAADTFSLYVDYEVDGRVYQHVYIGKVRSYVGKGDYVTIYYDKRNPGKVFSEISIKQNKVRFWVYWVILAVVIMIGFRAYKNPEEVSKSMLKNLTIKRRRW